MSLLMSSLGRGARGLFRDRQILIRSEQGTTHLHFRRSQQILLAGLAAGVLLWAVGMSAVSVVSGVKLADRALQIEDLEIGYADLIAEVAHQKGVGAVVASDAVAGGGGALTERILDRSNHLQREIGELRESLRIVEGERETLEQDRWALTATIDALRADLIVMADERAARDAQIAELGINLTSLSGKRNELIETQQSLRAEIADMTRALGDARAWNDTLDAQIDELTVAVQDAYGTVEHLVAERDGLRADLGAVHRSLSASLRENDRLSGLLRAAHLAAVELSTERDRMIDGAGEMSGRIGRLETRLSDLIVAQQELFAALRARANEHIVDLEQGLSFTGLDIDALISRLSGALEGQGGPFIPAIGDMPMDEAEVVDLVELVGRAAALRDLANVLPLAEPILADYRFTSGFGIRRDPFTGRRARHSGVDFAAPRRTEIHAPSAGTIVFAGRRGAYGNMVEIDHGLGLTTRYGHMHRISVREGQKVTGGDLIGLVGNTGRSTGPHLHYEVRRNGDPVDPMNFLRAGERVYEIDGQ